MKCFVAGLWIVLSTSLAYSQTVVHTVHWEKGVNKKVVKGWVSSLDKVSNSSSTTYIEKKSGGRDKLHRKGHRDVIVWIPSSTNLTKDFTTVVWFHGHHGYVPSRTFQDRTLKQFTPMLHKNFVLVVPEMPWSIHTKTPTKRNSMLWRKPGDFMRFIEQVKKIMLKHSAGQTIASTDYKIVGHSAGGSTIKRLGITGDLCKLNPSSIVWSDSSYGKWLDDSWNGCVKNHSGIDVKVFVHKGGPPWRNASRFLSKFKRVPDNLTLYVKSNGWSHKLIGNNVVKLSKLLESTNEVD